MKLTVQGWQNLVVVTMGGVVLAGAIAGVVLVDRADHVSTDLTGRINPARVAAYQLQAALRDQETAVRGYTIAADAQFLTPYFDGQRAETEAAEQIRADLSGRDTLIADLGAVQQAAADWRTGYAQPLIDSVVPGRPGVIDPRASELGKAKFDRLRGLFDVQNEHLDQARTAAVHQLAVMRHWRNGVLAAIVVAFFAMAFALAVMVHRAVTRPLDSLATACRRITEGRFEERIVPTGPTDIRAIASDVEAMRRRIVDELASSQRTQQTMAEQAVELRRSNAELEQFAYVASHDLQEPLRKVASFCQLLEKRYADNLDERGREYIGFAVDGAKRMQVLINDLLTFSRVGRLNAARTGVDLAAAVDIAVNNLAAAIEESGAEVVLDSGLPPVDGDLSLLVMLWQNLIGNAVKFQRPGVAPRIVVECREGTGDDAGVWVFTVSDNGIGVAAEFVDKVFVIFQRLHSRDAYPGTGIGLALCKKIVEYHGGAIWIDSSYVPGTRFVFTLPISASVKPDAVAEDTTEGQRH